MDETEFHNLLKSYGKYTILKLKTNRGIGSIENLVYFEGFDSENEPIVRFDGGARLDIAKIGGYSSIISVKEVSSDFG